MTKEKLDKLIKNWTEIINSEFENIEQLEALTKTCILVEKLARDAANKVTMTILGDPYWLFDEKRKIGLYAIKLNFYRPSVGIFTGSDNGENNGPV